MTFTINTIVAMAAAESSSDIMWFVKITDEREMAVKPYMMIMVTYCVMNKSFDCVIYLSLNIYSIFILFRVGQ